MEGRLKYLLFILGSSLFIFFAVYFSFYLMGWKAGAWHRFVCVFLIPVCLLLFAAKELFWPIALTSDEIELIAAGAMSDPGPKSFARAIYFGLLPAAVYSFLAIPLYLLLNRALKP